MMRPGTWRRELTVPLQSLQSELNRLFEEYWQPGSGVSSPSSPTDMAEASWIPSIDLFETPSEIVLKVDLPGVDPASIDLSLTGNVLTLRGEKPAPEVPEGHNRVRERSLGSFHRQITLTEAVDFDRVLAESKNGVLSVRLPKQEAARPRTIPIQPAVG
ncbi:Hsp20/alpha crystallin family protein [Tundrisphaera lichenicola]|uniref:Hsp20/alpha crystallin family protein n=1 Tax=Tundrisphaera lichenicola TaxID=2029860 RepID=UPI003EBE0390